MYDVSLPVSTDYQRNSLYRERGSRCNDEETRGLVARAGGKGWRFARFSSLAELQRREPTIQIELTRGIIQRPLHVTNARTHAHDATPPSSTTTASKQPNQQTLPNDRSLFGISLPSTEKIPFANRNNEIQ